MTGSAASRRRAEVVALTARGVGLLVGAVALLAIGFRYGYPDLAVLGAAAVTAVAGAGVAAAWRPQLAVQRTADPDRVPRGDPALVTLTVRNASRWRTVSLIATDRCAGGHVPVPLLRLRPGAETTVSYPVPTRRRGVVPIGPLRVVRRDWLGLLSLSRTHGDPITVWVHPRVYPLAAVPAGMARSLDGRIDRVPHGTITFDALREYVVGDELRHVHWRTSAKVGELMVREHVDTSLPRLVVLLDDRSDAHKAPRDGVSDSFEAACDAAASVIAAAVREGLPVTLRLVGGANAGPYLDVLTEAGLRDTDGLAATLRLLGQERPGDTLVFLTGPNGHADIGAVGALRGAYPAVIAGILGDDRPGHAPTGVTVIAAEDGERFAAAWDAVRRW